LSAAGRSSSYGYSGWRQLSALLSPELIDYRTVAPEKVKCWPAGTGHALADWLRTRGIEPQYMELPPGKRATEVDVD